MILRLPWGNSGLVAHISERSMANGTWGVEALYAHQHHGHQHRQPGWSLPPFGLHDDAAEEEFAKRSISSTEQTEQQQQGLIHPGPGRPGEDPHVRERRRPVRL